MQKLVAASLASFDVRRDTYQSGGDGGSIRDQHTDQTSRRHLSGKLSRSTITSALNPKGCLNPSREQATL